MTTRPVGNETDYDEALAEIDSLMGVAPGTPESDRLEVLVTLVERYELEHWGDRRSRTRSRRSAT